jgi:hypothetical protein
VRVTDDTTLGELEDWLAKNGATLRVKLSQGLFEVSMVVTSDQGTLSSQCAAPALGAAIDKAIEGIGGCLRRALSVDRFLRGE